MQGRLVGPSRRRQSGVTLIESLVAFAVVAVGTVSVMRLQRELRFNVDLSDQRAQASQLGHGAIERQRALAGTGTDPSAVPTSTAPGRNTMFTIAGSAGPLGASLDAAVTSRVSIAWPDATGAARTVSLDTIVGWANPALSAALSIRAIDSTATRIDGRSSAIPADVKDLGQGQSAWKPGASDPTVWLFDDITGRIVSRCTSASVANARDLTAADLSQCVAVRAILLSGIVRTSLELPPDASQANALPDPMSVVLSLSVPAQAAPPFCTTEAEQSVEAVFGTGSSAVLRRQAVALTATPASIGAVRWTDLGDRFAAYRCVVADPPGGWSGRATVVPASPVAPASPALPMPAAAAWTIGESAHDRRICRYVPSAGNVDAAPRNGPIDPNTRHPADYQAVTQSLTQQNFLVIRGDQACPAPANGSATTTVQQQP